MKKQNWIYLFIFLLAGSWNACSDDPAGEVPGEEEEELSYPDRYYIDPENGAYYNTGHSPSQAWESVDRILERSWKAGDTILIKRGTVYEGTLALKGSGASGAPIVLGSYGDEELPLPEIRGGGKSETILLQNVEYWELHDLKITNKGAEPYPKCAGIRLVAENIPGGTMNHIHIKRCVVQDVYGNKTQHLEQGGAAIHYFNVIEGTSPSNFNDILIEDCHFLNCQRDGAIGYLSTGDRSLRKANTKFVVRRNLFEGIPGDHILINGCDDALVEENIVRKCAEGAFSPEGAPNVIEAAAAVWCMHSDRTIFRYNIVQDHKATWDGQAFDCDQNCQNTLFEYNISYNNAGGFFLLCPSDVSFDKGYAESSGTIVRYNISINDGTRDYLKENGKALSSTIDVVGRVASACFYNNTIIKTKSAARHADNSAITFDYYTNIPGSLVFMNNIFYNTTGEANPFCKLNYGTLEENRGLIFRNNCVYGYSTPVPGSGDYNSENIAVDPGFAGLVEDFLSNNELVDKEQILEGLKLATGSPCLNAGTTIEDGGFFPVTLDFWGASPDTTNHIGAYNH